MLDFSLKIAEIVANALAWYLVLRFAIVKLHDLASKLLASLVPTLGAKISDIAKVGREGMEFRASSPSPAPTEEARHKMLAALDLPMLETRIDRIKSDMDTYRFNEGERQEWALKTAAGLWVLWDLEVICGKIGASHLFALQSIRGSNEGQINWTEAARYFAAAKSTLPESFANLTVDEWLSIAVGFELAVIDQGHVRITEWGSALVGYAEYMGYIAKA